MTIKELYLQIMPEEKRKEEKFNIFAHWIGRPISIVLTLPFIRLKVKPTTITKCSIVFLLVGFYFVGFGETVELRLLGWGFFFFWNLFDGIDGNLARCTNQCSWLGDLWDTMSGYASIVLTYFAIGIAAFYDANSVYLCENHCFLILGGATAIMAIFPRLIMHKKKSYESSGNSVKELSDKKSFGLKKILAMNVISPSGFMQIIFLVCILYHILNVFIVIYSIINMGIMLVSLNILLKK